MKELRAQASAAERAVADYKAKNNIIDAGGRLLTEQQLAELNSSLTVARTQRAEASARLERITAILKADDSDRNVILNDLATVTDTLQNPVIQKLRQTYLDYAAKESDWSKSLRRKPPCSGQPSQPNARDSSFHNRRIETNGGRLQERF